MTYFVDIVGQLYHKFKKYVSHVKVILESTNFTPITTTRFYI